MRSIWAMLSLFVAILSSAALAGDWTVQGGDAGGTKYSVDNIPAQPLELLYSKRFYSKWTNWTGSYGNYQPANNVLIKNGQAVLLSNDSPDIAGEYGPIYTTRFNWQTGATIQKSTIPSNPDGSPRWFHGGENPAEIDSHHFKFPIVMSADGRLYARRGGDQRAMGSMNMSNNSWTYVPSDGTLTGWAGDTSAFLTTYKDRLVYYPGDTRDNWRPVAANISKEAWDANTPAKSITWLSNSAPYSSYEYYRGLQVGASPMIAKDTVVTASYHYDTSAGTFSTYLTASNIYSGQQLWAKSMPTNNSGPTGFYTGTWDYSQYVATESGYYAMFNRAAGSNTQIKVMDVTTGQDKWSYNLPTNTDRPLMAHNNGKLYIVSREEQTCFNIADGSVEWRQTNKLYGDSNYTVDDAVYRSMVLTNDTMFFIDRSSTLTANDRLIGMRTSDGSIFYTLDLTSLVAAKSGERLLAVQDMFAADGKLGLLLDIAMTGDTHAGGNTAKYQDLLVLTVPEPMTISLLAAGLGVLLRRRK